MERVPADLSPLVVVRGRVVDVAERVGGLRGRPEALGRLPLLPLLPLRLLLLLLLILRLLLLLALLVVLLVVGSRLEVAFLSSLSLLEPSTGSPGNAGGGCFVEQIAVVDRLEH